MKPYIPRDGVFKNSEEKPFLSAHEEDEGSTGPSVSATQQRARKRIYHVYSIHLTLIVLYTAASALVIRWNTHHCVEPRSVLKDLKINFAPKIHMTMHESPYVGPPSPKVDDAWSDLIGNTSIRVTESELAQNGQKSVRLPGGGYLAWLGAFHQLHCAKMLRQLNYRDHYHPNLTTKEQADWQVHADHCIELLRASAMCHADTSSLTTFVWDTSEKPMLSAERPPHRCVDWDTLVASMMYRRVGREETAQMQNPLLHPDGLQ